MNTQIWKVMALMFMLFAITPVAATEETLQTATPTPQPTVEVKREKIDSQALAGNLLGDPTERTVYVLLPPGYATSDKRYPVVYVTPGGLGEPSGPAFKFEMFMKSLLGKGEIKEMIVVVPDGTDKLGFSFFMSSSTIGDYETYLTQEVVGYVDTHYRTLPTSDSRGITGCSRGGTASMRLGFRYPTVFSVVASGAGEWDYSLDVWPSDLETVQRLKQLPRIISDFSPFGIGWYVEMAAATAPDPNNPPFYCEMPFRIVDGRGEFVQRSLPGSLKPTLPTKRAGIYSSRSDCEAFSFGMGCMMPTFRCRFTVSYTCLPT
ncbi:esterase [Candidatus Moduliflexus flocculans]|uniref:Esterase n=1 Tax=Candidatus Moduliflexus flocculans TaxID=1499966 RepID=A0A0S6W5I8_9BACT|nr:esterase [Candidatus Moduliflexus flocculans]